MAGKSLGTLTIDLIAKVGGFTSGMDKAERASDKWRKKVESDIKSAGSAISGMAALAVTSATAITAVGVALLKTSSAQITETDRWAKSLGASTQVLLEWKYAAQQAGIEGDNIADIFKDLNDKIGDAVLNQSGEAAGALDTLGLSAKKLQDLSPEKQLLAIVDAMKGMNTAQKTNILESLGNDLSRMLPLFDNGNEKLNKFIQQARDFGVAPPQEDIDKLVKVNQVFQEIQGSWDGFKNKMATGLADIDMKPLVDSVHSLEKTFTDPAVLQGIVNITKGITDLVGLLAQAAKLANDFAYGWNKSASTSADSSFNDLLSKRKELNDSLAYSESFLGKIDVAAGVIRGSEQIRAEIAKNEKLIGEFNTKLPTQFAVISESGGLELGKGETNGKPTPDAGAKKLESAFKATELGYMRQIALIETTGKKTAEVTEAEKLRFDLASGKLVGINAEQQKRLVQLADELDKLQALKKANEENLKVAAFAANLKSSNDNDRQTLNADIVGAGMGEKTRSRMKELLGIQQDFITQQQELQKQYQSGDITKSLFDKETQALQDALKERLEIQEDYYKQSDEQRDDWSSGISDALVDFADRSSDYYQQAADAMTSVLGAATDSISDHLYDVISGTESMGDAIKGIFSDLGQSVVKALIDMAAQWLVYQGVQLLINKTTQASAIPAMVANAQATALQAQLAAFASTAAIPIVGPGLAPAAMASAAAVTMPMVAAISAAGLSGMAHDGIDAVPETGTWLLQKGERVTTAGTSAKLDATLERVSRDANTGGKAPYAPVTHLTVNGDPDKSTIRAIEEAVSRGNKRLYGQMTSDVATGRGDMSKALGTGWQTKRRTG
ncbi:Phage-related minor tail protein [Serratia ficaria]|uniref:phage tail tape measure protein n=1 Tax=Serratia ficaria TaxID=61651 RepID=UPI002182B152|nr:phage tail tape measure protein [Serratia ficaria]CAI2497119.1 Phage-related minor tail protein [Serratia ficaria]